MSQTPPTSPTDDTAEEPQAGGVTLPSIPRTLPPGRGQRDAQPDWSVKFASARLNGHHRAEGRLVAKLPSQQLIGDGLRLRRGRGVVKKQDVEAGCLTSKRQDSKHTA